MIPNFSKSVLYYAQGTFNGDPFELETDEEVDAIYDLYENRAYCEELTAEDGEEFANAADLLDLPLDKCDIKVIYRIQGNNQSSHLLLCLDRDWDLR